MYLAANRRKEDISVTQRISNIKGGEGMKVKFRYLLLIIILLSMIYPQSALANGGPIGHFNDEQNIIFFDEESNISLVEARIKFSEFDFSSMVPRAKVEVTYILRNRDDFPKELSMYFVVPPSEGILVRLNGLDITNKTRQEEVRLPKNWQPSSKPQILNPDDGRTIYRHIYTMFEEEYKKWHDHLYGGVVIPITIEGDGEAIVEIEYVTIGGFYRGYINRINGFIYYLTPAKFWEGNTRLTLQVELPPGRFRFYSNIPLEQNEQGIFHVTLQGIPDDEWQFSFYTPDGLMFGTNNPNTERRIILSIIAVIYPIFLLIAFVKRKTTMFWFGHIFTGALYVIYIMRISGPYSFFPPFLMLILFFFSVYLLVPKVILSIWKKIFYK